MFRRVWIGLRSTAPRINRIIRRAPESIQRSALPAGGRVLMAGAGVAAAATATATASATNSAASPPAKQPAAAAAAVAAAAASADPILTARRAALKAKYKRLNEIKEKGVDVTDAELREYIASAECANCIMTAQGPCARVGMEMMKRMGLSSDPEENSDDDSDSPPDSFEYSCSTAAYTLCLRHTSWSGEFIDMSDKEKEKEKAQTAGTAPKPDTTTAGAAAPTAPATTKPK